jgi:malate synthase
MRLGRDAEHLYRDAEHPSGRGADGVLNRKERVMRTSVVELVGADGVSAESVLTPDALEFVAGLHQEFEPRRRQLLEARAERRARLAAGDLPDFPAETAEVRAGDWRVPPAPPGLRDRRVEITGPVERKMMINALNSGAKVFMADFEDSLTPSWSNLIAGQENLASAVAGTISLSTPDKEYRLNDEVATLVVRPRGWHLTERHLLVGGEPVSGALFDFGLFLFHNAQALLERGLGPYLYLPKLEGRHEARLWNDVFVWSQEALGLERGTIRVTALIETILAAFEMEEILFELGEHATGLNAGRWDYIFSVIKSFRERPEFLLPDRAQVTMTVPFMRAYTELLVRSCHRRGAHAIGGMAAFIPSRRDPEVNARAIAQVRADKEREAADGFDGSWVAHPDLVAPVREVFDAVLADRPNQLERGREDVAVKASELLDVAVPDGQVTEAGLRNDITVGIQYLASWLRGNGAAAVLNLMEDTATAEISRSQVWQWTRHGARLEDGREVTPALVRELQREELAKLTEAAGGDGFDGQRFSEAADLFERVALGEELVEFLTIPAGERLG